MTVRYAAFHLESIPYPTVGNYVHDAQSVSRSARCCGLSSAKGTSEYLSRWTSLATDSWSMGVARKKAADLVGRFCAPQAVRLPLIRAPLSLPGSVRRLPL